MRSVTRFLTVAAILFGIAYALGAPAFAEPNDPLFINMTTDDPHRAKMAIIFGSLQMEKGHPLTIFLNDKGVKVGSKTHGAQYAEHQKLLVELMEKGAALVACPMCMEHYQVKAGDLMDGIKQGNPDLTGGLLFKENTKTLTW